MLLYNKEIGSTWIGIQNISSVVEFQRWWVLKSKSLAKNPHTPKEIIFKKSYEECQFIKNWT